MEVKLPALKGNNDGQEIMTDRSTERRTDRQAHREVSLPKVSSGPS